ncbi:MMPL family transporter [Paenibacillus durus]|uniref:SSD domain-containing protein n=1 Tax=Paenibacillus durus TaxID=44251 RepID=A0A089HML4_PAEDU|nr:MMPL family transporter [Paenibacillus durus]AIQ12342.1 hypothetical protein PDUR_10765 [Paenibacillus durus]
MAKYLYQLGKWAASRPFRVIAGGVTALVIAVVLGIGMGTSFSDDMSIPGTKSEQAMKILTQYFPSDETEGKTVQLLFKAPQGQTLESESVAKTIKAALGEIGKDPAVDSVAGPNVEGMMSPDRKIGSSIIIYKVKTSDVTESSKELVLENVERARDTGVQTEIGNGFESSEPGIGGTSEIIGIIAAYLILAFTFASFLAAGLPILTSVLGLGIGIMCIMIGSNFFNMSSVSLSLAVMLGLAVGIDYALFIISRYRQQLNKGFGVTESIGQANATAGSAVVFAGLTVIIALAGLSVVGIPFLTAMGLAAAVSVLIAIIIAILIVPAALGLAGKRISPARPNRLLRKRPRSGAVGKISNRWGRFVIRFPLPIAVIGVLILAIVSLPALHLNTGLPNDGTKSVKTTERRAYDLLTEWQGVGMHGPLVVVAQAADRVENPQAAIAKATERLNNLPNVAGVSPLIPSDSEQVAMITVIPKTGPADSKTKDLVNLIRDKAEGINTQDHVELMVTGSTAVDIDISAKLNQALPKFLLLIVGLAFVLLAVVFRSILVPLKAVLGYLLTITATLGFVVFVVQDGNWIHMFGIPEPGPVLNYLPILTAGILFGLAMDYEMFLVSRMREEYSHTGDASKAILEGIGNSGAVVTSAGFIMIAVFAGFIFAEDPVIKAMGISLSFGILFDAFVVRLAIVPAVMRLLGRSAWYLPKWLGRIIPNVDVEGETVMKQLESEQRAG